MQADVQTLSLLVAALSLVFAFWRYRASEGQGAQAIRDKLDYISGITRDTRDSIRELDRKIDDHGERLTRMETKVSDLDRRVGIVERRTDGA